MSIAPMGDSISQWLEFKLWIKTQTLGPPLTGKLLNLYVPQFPQL